MSSGHYESIGEYATVDEAVASSTSHHAQLNNINRTTTTDTDVGELTYVAVKSYSKRKSGEVNLQQGSTVSVLQRELSGDYNDASLYAAAPILFIVVGRVR